MEGSGVAAEPKDFGVMPSCMRPLSKQLPLGGSSPLLDHPPLG